MALIRCPECGKEISDRAKSCPNCGFPVEGGHSQKDVRNEYHKSLKTFNCYKCGKPIPEGTNICIYCGCDYRNLNHDGIWKKGKMPILFVAILLLGIFAFFNKDNDDSSNSKSSPTAKVSEKNTEELNQESELVEANNVQQNKDSIKIYYMDLYNTYENYIGKYVTITGPLSYVDGKSLDIKGEITGFTGMINIALDTDEENLQEGEYVTVTGVVDKKVAGYLYMENAFIESRGKESELLFEQQSQLYAEQKASNRVKNMEVYIEECNVYSYNDLVRYPDKYAGSKICYVLSVEQAMPAGFLTDEGYRCYEVGTDNEIVLVDVREEKEPKLVVGDVVTVYGEYSGVETMKRVLTGEKVPIPCIEMLYFSFQ